MSKWERRLAALEEQEQQREAAEKGPVWYQNAVADHEQIGERFADWLPHGESLDLALDLLIRNLRLLAWCVERSFPEHADAVRWSRRWPDTLLDFLGRLPGELRVSVLRALGDREQLLGRWLHHLSDGSSRLPAGVSQDVLVSLVRVYLDRREDIDSVSMTCKACGLERPDRKLPHWSLWKVLPGKVPFESERPWYDLPPEFFAACPHCGDKEFEWTHVRPATLV
jgi:hypothetical protein